MRIAIIGSGAAGFGAVLGLCQHAKGGSIEVFDAARPLESPLARETDPREWLDGHIAEIYRATAREAGFSLPLPKSHFGRTIPRIKVDGRPRIWRSSVRGGLTNFWGGTMLPLHRSEFDGWPISSDTLAPYYHSIIEEVGVSGAPDALGAVFDDGYVNRPALRIHPLVRRLINAVARNKRPGALIAGINRIALETRPDRPNACVYCGECLIGCFRNAPFSTADFFRRKTAEGTVRLFDAEIARIDLNSRRILAREADGEQEWAGPYDRIFVAAGAAGTTRLLMESLGLDEALLKDSAVINTPIFFLGSDADRQSTDEGFGLTHGIVLVPDDDGERIVAQTQLYPTLPHFWRSVTPAPLWGAAGFAGAALNARLIWARSYLADEAANRYMFRRASNEIESIPIAATGRDTDLSVHIPSRFAQALEGSGFSVIRRLSQRGPTSSHYGSVSPFRIGEGVVRNDFSVADGVYIVDSTAWPSLPATSPTMTIMANAMRITEQAD